MALSDPLVTVHLSELQDLLKLPGKVAMLEADTQLLLKRYDALYARFVETCEAVNQLRHEI